MSVWQRKNLSLRQDWNQWPPKHQAGTLFTWATENSWRARPYTRFILFLLFILCCNHIVSKITFSHCIQTQSILWPVMQSNKVNCPLAFTFRVSYGGTYDQMIFAYVDKILWRCDHSNGILFGRTFVWFDLFLKILQKYFIWPLQY